MSDINIEDGCYHYTVGFNDVNFEIDIELYLGAPNIAEAINEAFGGDFVDISELGSVTYIEITNYCADMAGTFLP